MISRFNKAAPLEKKGQEMCLASHRRVPAFRAFWVRSSHFTFESQQIKLSTIKLKIIKYKM